MSDKQPPKRYTAGMERGDALRAALARKPTTAASITKTYPSRATSNVAKEIVLHRAHKNTVDAAMTMGAANPARHDEVHRFFEALTVLVHYQPFAAFYDMADAIAGYPPNFYYRSSRSQPGNPIISRMAEKWTLGHLDEGLKDLNVLHSCAAILATKCGTEDFRRKFIGKMLAFLPTVPREDEMLFFNVASNLDRHADVVPDIHLKVRNMVSARHKRPVPATGGAVMAKAEDPK